MGGFFERFKRTRPQEPDPTHESSDFQALFDKAQQFSDENRQMLDSLDKGMARTRHLLEATEAKLTEHDVGMEELQSGVNQLHQQLKAVDAQNRQNQVAFVRELQARFPRLAARHRRFLARLDPDLAAHVNREVPPISQEHNFWQRIGAAFQGFFKR